MELDASIEKDLGLGSLERVELLSRVESAFGVELPESVLAEAETPADLVQSVLSVEAPIAKARAEAVTPVLASPSFSIEAETLLEVLRLRAEAEPQRAHIHLQSEGGREEVIRYGELHGQAREVAGGLVERGVHRGDTVALMLPTSRDFFTAFAGILLAGGVPVPLYPPFSLDKIGEYVGRQADILLNSQANILITVDRGRSVGHVLRRRVPNMRSCYDRRRASIEHNRRAGALGRSDGPGSHSVHLWKYWRSQRGATFSLESSLEHSSDRRSARFETDRRGC